ncbi:MAG: RDD family protein [Atopobiaceae bacterium]|nr:RDD family protein [Atopobiaceae bacterium]
MSSKKHKKKQMGNAETARAAALAKAEALAEAEVRAEEEKPILPKAAKAVTKLADKAGAPAPITRRFFAYLIDWYVGALCTAIPISLVAYKTTGDITNQYLTDYPSPFGIVAGVFALIFAFAYYILIPLFVWRGQTPGKRLCGIKIVQDDGSPVALPNLALRQIVGVTIIEGVIANASSIWHQMLTIVTGINFVHPLMYVGFAITLVSCFMILIRKDHRCLHDFIGGTRVALVEKS